MSCCSSITINPCSISINDALTLLNNACCSCGTFCDANGGGSISTPMPPSPLPQYATFIQVEENNVNKGTFNILNFWATGASVLTVTNAGNGQADILIDTQLAERILRNDALTLLSGNDLVPGKLYWIYDVGDGELNPAPSASAAYAGIVLKALDVNKFSLEGAYISRVPNMQSFKHWRNAGSYVINSVVYHLNGVYTNNAAQTVPPYDTPPSANTAVWTRTPKSDDTKYKTEIYFCLYNIQEDQIYSITDTRNNTVSVTNFTGNSSNELFQYCFRWGANNVYGNKITINNIGTQTGFFAGTYPNIARTGANKANLNFTDSEFYGNEIRLDFGKSSFGPSAFNSRMAGGASGYSSFFDTSLSLSPPTFNNNTLYNCLTNVNELVRINDNIFYDCTLGGNNLNIIDTFGSTPNGTISFCKFTRCNINSNTGIFARCELTDCTISGNTNHDMADVYGHIDIKNNADCFFRLITSHTRVTNTINYTTFNEIVSNINVYLEDISGHFFRINSNENISVRFNTTIYNGYILSNTATATPIVLDQNGVNQISVPAGTERLSCSIQQVQLDNQARIENNRWETAGGIVRTKLSGSEIRDMIFDFRDPLWAGGGAQVNPPAASDMQVDGVNVYLFQNRNKLSLYPHPSTVDGLAATSFCYIDGSVGVNRSTLPMLNAFIYTGTAYTQVPIVSTEEAYANGVNIDTHGGGAYVFLNTEDANIYSSGTATLTLPEWTKHASIIYLYNKSPFTVTIANIVDLAAISRTLFNFRIVVLSDSLTLNVTTSAMPIAANRIASSVGPAPTTVTITNKYDVLELEKRNNRYYVSNYQRMA